MSKVQFSIPFINREKPIDWPLLVFLLLFVNVKLVVKVAAVLLIYLVRPNGKFGFAWKQSRLPLFYPVVMGIAVLNWLINGEFRWVNTNILLLTALLFWLLCILAIHQVKLSVEQQGVDVLHRTLFVFFIANVVVSLAVFGRIVWETGTINPYRYQGNFQEYFIGTGDYIKGISFDTSTTNAVLNAIGVIYFLQRNRYLLALLCMIVLLLTGSNLMNLLLAGVLLYLFVLKTTKAQKSMIVVCLLGMVVFWGKVSPQNNRYVTEVFSKLSGTPIVEEQPVKIIPLQLRPDSILNETERKEKFALLYLDSMRNVLLAQSHKTAAPVEKPQLPQDDIHSASFQYKNDTTLEQKELMDWMQRDSVSLLPLTKNAQPGKVLAFSEMLTFLRTHPAVILTGTGAGHFSSKLAFKASGLHIAGGYPQRFSFISPYFKDGHLALYLHYFTQTAGLHSLANSPNSVYGQIVSEYGLLGLAALVFLYFGFFVKGYKKMTYGVPLLLLMAGVFFIDYWFEQLSVVAVFELLLLLNSKEVKV